VSLEKRLVVNPKTCLGCRLCELACSFRHSKTFRPSVARIKIKLFSKEGISIPVVCLQCKERHCIDACKSGAIEKNQRTGATEISIDKCTGCKACMSACPYGGVGYDGDLKKAIVCDLCQGEPECIRYCFVRAIEFADGNSTAFVKGEDYITTMKESCLE
jgi:anaerobic carbon-monoxide dehydrogenase iron sulfur subunit